MKQRFDLVRAVLGGSMTISDAAEQLQIARVNMQTLVHRAEAAITEVLQPRAPGPTPKSAEQKALEARLEKLEKENEKLKRQLQAADDMMGAAGEIIRHLRGLPATSKTSSSRSRRSPRKPPSNDEDPDPDPEPEPSTRQQLLERALTALTMRDVKTRASRALGMSANTLTRWIGRLARGQPLSRPRGGVRRAGPAASEQRVRELVIELHGLVGADSLARCVQGVSRRRASELKHEVLTARERERKAASAHVAIVEPGIVRGFDAMHLHAGYALIASDACVPYRTTVAPVLHYDADSVARVLEEDFEAHGAPWVLRCDCARCHSAPAVLSVLERRGVVLLQGPPYYAPYYGQLERQNLEHRRWLDWLDPACAEMQHELARMKNAFNDLWRRPTLDWRTPRELWEQRRPLDDERSSFLDDVHTRAEQLRAHDLENRLAMRLAIEQALKERGKLRVTTGRQALCELPV